MMVPDLPLTPNGKVDRKALPAPDETAASALTEPPRGPLEATVADLFAEVVNHRRVGIHDSFFEHGGHSLTAVQVIARVRAVFGVEIPVRALFESPSVAELAAGIAEARLARADAADKDENDANDANDVPSVPLRPASQRGPLPCAPRKRCRRCGCHRQSHGHVTRTEAGQEPRVDLGIPDKKEQQASGRGECAQRH